MNICIHCKNMFQNIIDIIIIIIHINYPLDKFIFYYKCIPYFLIERKLSLHIYSNSFIFIKVVFNSLIQCYSNILINLCSYT